MTRPGCAMVVFFGAASISALMARDLRAQTQAGDSPDARRIHAAVEKLTQDDRPGTRAALYTALSSGVLLVPTSVRPAAKGRITVFEFGPIRPPPFELVRLGGDRKGLAAFTEVAFLEQFRPEGAQIVYMQGRQLFLMALDMQADLIAVNPGSPVSGVLERFELQRIAEGTVPIGQNRTELTRDVPMRVRPLQASSPGKLRRLLVTAFRKMPEIRTAYLFEVSMNGAPYRLAVGVELEKESGSLNAKMSELMEGLGREGIDIRVFPFDAHFEELAAEVEAEFEPFYSRAP
ncbi:MAG: SseB family protein [Deltaproteobacteria bacterium]|nr:SseB family protein [Deltaproteobacteria bacterium]